MKNRSKSLIKNTSILSFGTFCTKGIMFIMTPLFTRWLTTTEYGNFDLMVSYITLLLPLLTLATGESLFRFLLSEDNKVEKERVLSTALIIYLIGGLCSVLLICLFIFIFKLDFLIYISFISYLITEMFYNYLMMSMRGIKRLDVYTIGNITYVIGISIFVSIFVWKYDFGLPGILFGYACADILSIVIMLTISQIYRNINFQKVSFYTLKRMIKYSLPMIPNSISWWVVNISDRTLITIFLGSKFNAIYAVANKIPGLCNTFFSVFHLSWQQNATETMQDSDRDLYYSTVMNNMLVVIGSICILILGINYWFFKILFTSDYFLGYYQAPILVLAIIFSMLGQFIGGIYVAQMKSKKNGLTTVMAAVLNIIVNIMFIQNFGIYAASSSTLISYLFLFIIRFLDIRKEIKINFNKKSYVIFIFVIYFVISSYFSIPFIHVLNFLLGTFLFVLINYSYIKKFIAKFDKEHF